MSVRTLFLCAGLSVLNVLALDVVSNGKSGFSIYVGEGVPASVSEGARELQTYCQKVTGVKLPIVGKPTKRMISLGDNESLRAAGFNPQDITLEGYAVKVSNGSVFVYGQDTPDGKTCYGGGRSNGTRNGVYALLEECFGIRWLMPGEFGEYYKPMKTVSVPDAGMADAPFFLNRRVPYIHEELAVVKQWGARQKLGLSLYLHHSHNWLQTCSPEEFDRHPEWFAVVGGKHVRPTAEYSKLCPTNPATIKRFCEAIDEYFTQHPERTCFSLSPSDGGGWCQCETCRSMYEEDPDGKLSTTPAILYFYNEVAKVIHPKYPDKFLAGYIYANYLYPPRKPVALADGLFLTLAPSFDYGHTLYRPDIRERFESVMSEWPKSTTNISFYDLPQTLHNSLGMPSAPGIEILKYMYPRIAAAKMKGVYVYGTQAWGHAGVANYLIARLAWNPYLDVEKEFETYCNLAYAEAGPDMAAIFRLYDEATKAYFNAHHEETYTASKGRMQEVYAATLPKVSEMFAAAEKKVTDRNAKERMRYFKVNLQIMEWSFKIMELLKPEFTSVFTLDDEDINALMMDKSLAFAIFKAERRLKKSSLVFTEAAGVQKSVSDRVFKPVVRGPQALVVKAKADGDIRIRLKAVRLYGNLMHMDVYDENSKPIVTKFIKMNVPVSFPAKAGKVYRVYLNTGKQDFYVTNVDNAFWGYVDELDRAGVHMMGEPLLAAIYVPKGTKSFRLFLRTMGGGETAKAVLTSPTGRTVTFDCTNLLENDKTLTVTPGEDGFWTMDVTKGDRGVLDDFYIQLADGIPPVLCLDLPNALEVTSWKRTE